jgi:hypothetical protein
MKMEWISVKDRLPESHLGIDHYVSQPVLCYFLNGHLEDCQIYIHKERMDLVWVFCADGEDVDEGSITHWMPLPEPPQNL